MTAAYRSGTSSLSLPQTQNTAPVLEFDCLYTHDIRRKSKRWQDGFLRFHTFNNRVMVYDIPRNFVGDTHWKGTGPLADGDEVTLEKDGVLVQVAESVGRTETDLTEVRKSKKQFASDLSSPARSVQTPRSRPVPGSASRPATQLKHRSLNALLGTPKGQIGKAILPVKSPFEERYGDDENAEWERGNPPKRQRVESPSAKPKAAMRSSSPAFQAQDPVPSPKRSRRTHCSSPSNAINAGEPKDPSASVNRNSSAGRTQQQSDAPSIAQPSRETEAVIGTSNSMRPLAKPSQTLRLTGTANKRKTLACQDQLENKPSQHRRSTESASRSTASSDTPSRDTITEERVPTAQEKKLQERLVKINQREAKAQSRSGKAARETITIIGDDDGTPNARERERNSTSRPQTPLENSALELARMDQMIMPSMPPPSSSPPQTEPQPQPAPAKTREIPCVPQTKPIRAPSQQKRPQKRFPGDPVRLTPSPPTTAAKPTKPTAPATSNPATTPHPTLQSLAVPAPKARPKKGPQRPVAFNTGPRGASGVVLGKPFQAPKKPGERVMEPVKELEPDPWSAEAGDLLDWRPPGWDEGAWCMKEGGGWRV